jgi:hypothetical protein
MRIHLVAPKVRGDGMDSAAPPPPPSNRPEQEQAWWSDRLQQRGRTGSWRTAIENQATRLQMLLDGILEENRIQQDDDYPLRKATGLNPVLQRIQNDLTLALEITQSGTSGGLLGRLRELWTGSGFEQALAAVNRASEMLLLVQPGPAVLARLPDLRAGVKDHLRVTDPRFDVFTRIIDAAERRAGLLPPEDTTSK